MICLRLHDLSSFGQESKLLDPSYQVPIGRQITEIEVKKSRFICWLDYAEGREDLKQLLAEARQAHPSASHHCWAFSSFNGRHEGQGDDGEPKGTAGRPILTVLQYAEVSNVAAVVIRYFGGTKLGTGGLARAYGEAAKYGLQALQTETYSPKVYLSFEAGFEQEAQIRYIVDQAEAEITVEYGSCLRVRIYLNESKLEFVQDHLRRDFPQLEVRVEDG